MAEEMIRMVRKPFPLNPPRIAVMVGLAILAAGFLAPEPFRSSSIDSAIGQIVLIAALAMVIVGLSTDVYMYLRTSVVTRIYGPSDFIDGGLRRDEIKEELDSLRALVEESATDRGKVILSEDDVEEVKRRTIEGLGSDTIEKITETLRQELKEKAPEVDPTIAAVQNVIISSQRRLKSEVDALGRRANVNLVIGFVVSLVGMIALAYFIYTANAEMDRNLDLVQVGVRFVVKLSLVIFMQVFAYFFLRLYRHSLFEIKYFQNELTNIEAKYLALNVALSNGSADAVKSIAAELAQTERNFILKKGESTVALQREEIEARYEAMVATKAEALIDRVGSAIQGKTK